MKKLTFILVLAVTLFTGQMFAFVYANHGCRAYDDCGGEGIRSSGASIGQLTAEAAGYFLRSYSGFLMFLDKVETAELNGVNYTELQEKLNCAIADMERASGTLASLVQLAGEKPYNPLVIEKLRKFNYQDYMKKKGLTRVVFKKVKGFLQKGDVTGAYMKLKADMDAIIQQLVSVKDTVDANIFPDISLLWRINQAIGNNMSFGQYMAEVFMNL